MITAHIPSGFVLGRSFGWRGTLLVAAIIGATWPDLDLFFFYFVDGRAFHHHRYWVHAPAFALVVSVGIWAVAGRYRSLAIAFGAGWMLHLVLDSLTGGVMWLWPLSDHLFNMIDVPATPYHFLISFLIHWTIMFEVLIWFVALYFWRQGARSDAP